MTGVSLKRTAWLLLMLALAAVSQAAGGVRLPLVVPGGSFGAAALGGKTDAQDQALSTAAGEWNAKDNVLARKVTFPARGVWYVWVKVSSQSPEQAVLSYDLDDRQPLHSDRSRIFVQPGARGQWLNYSGYPDFKIEVHVDQPGEHLLKFTQLRGKVQIEKIYLTLYYSAQMKEKDLLDHTHDPGLGFADFASSAVEADGVLPDWQGPAIESTRSYHVDAEKGDDKASGLSPASAWKTLAAVNGHLFKPGDAVLLKRGGRWSGSLQPKGSGTRARWITMGAYGEGERPRVDGQTLPALSLKDQSYWVVRDLQATTDPAYGQNAIEAMVSEKAPRPKGLKVLNCTAFDSGKHGIDIGGNAGYDGVLVENCLSFCNAGDGIMVHGQKQDDCRNTVIRRCTAYSNPGMAGIWIQGGQNGLIERCLAYNNACVNIWAWNAINITMRHCESFRGRPPRDAAGFDIDWGCEAVTLEFCYSHHCEGLEILLMGGGEAKYQGFPLQSRFCLARYNVAVGPQPCGLTETFQEGKVYNNLFACTAPGSFALRLDGWPNDPNGWGGGWPSDTQFLNNILFARKGSLALKVDDYAARQGNVFDYNLYLRGEPVPGLLQWGGRQNGPGFWKGDARTGTFPPAGYAGLAAFREATGQELHSIEADPGAAAFESRQAGRLPLEGFRLKKGTLASKAGIKVVLDAEWLRKRRAMLTETGAEEWGIPMEPAEVSGDYWGDRLETPPSIGPQN